MLSIRLSLLFLRLFWHQPRFIIVSSPIFILGFCWSHRFIFKVGVCSKGIASSWFSIMNLSSWIICISSSTFVVICFITTPLALFVINFWSWWIPNIRVFILPGLLFNTWLFYEYLMVNYGLIIWSRRRHHIILISWRYWNSSFLHGVVLEGEHLKMINHPIKAICFVAVGRSFLLLYWRWHAWFFHQFGLL